MEFSEIRCWVKLKCNRVCKYIRPLSFVNLVFYTISLLTLIVFILFIKETFTNGFVNSNRLLALVGVGGALISLIYNIRRHLSEDYYKEAKSQLEKAFDTLKPKPFQKVINDRVKWLTCARLLLSAERIGNQIIMGSHKRIYEEDKQYWRVKFSEIIEDFPIDYYSPEVDTNSDNYGDTKMKLFMPSVYAVHSFMKWDENYLDPLRSYEPTPDLKFYFFHKYPNLWRVIEKSDKK